MQSRTRRRSVYASARISFGFSVGFQTGSGFEPYSGPDGRLGSGLHFGFCTQSSLGLNCRRDVGSGKRRTPGLGSGSTSRKGFGLEFGLNVGCGLQPDSGFYSSFRRSVRFLESVSVVGSFRFLFFGSYVLAEEAATVVRMTRRLPTVAGRRQTFTRATGDAAPSARRC